MGVSHCRLTAAINRACVVVLVQRCLRGERKVSGRSIMVGMMIFSIVVG